MTLASCLIIQLLQDGDQRQDLIFDKNCPKILDRSRLQPHLPFVLLIRDAFFGRKLKQIRFVLVSITKY